MNHQRKLLCWKLDWDLVDDDGTCFCILHIARKQNYVGIMRSIISARATFGLARLFCISNSSS